MVNEPLGPVALLLLVIPAIALRLAIRALYGRRRLTAADPMQMLLSLSSAILFMLAGLGVVVGLMGLWFLMIPLPIALVILVLMMIDRTRHSEHRALIWSLSAAAEKGVPLSEAARAFADETLGDTGVRALALAEAIERGEPLADAARYARLRMGAAMKLAVRLGERLGMLGPALRQQLQASEQIDSALANVINRGFYLLGVVFVLTFVATFTLLKIVPVYQKMFEEFGLKLPAPTVLVIETANNSQWAPYFVAGLALLLALIGAVWGTLLVFHFFSHVWPLPPRKETPTVADSVVRAIRLVIRVALSLAAFLILWLTLWPSVILLLLLPMLLYYVGWFPRDLPIVWRLFKRFDGALVMRGLALSVRRGLPIYQALLLLRETYPLSHAGQLLEGAAGRVIQGQDWCESLRRTGLIGRADAAVLAAAQRVGNLDWALEEMADSALRRITYWIQSLISVAFPVILLVLAGFVMFLVVGLFLPLISLIQGLT